VAEHQRVSPLARISTRVLIIVGAVVAALAALYLGAVVAAGDGVRSGTVVNGVNIGGMSAEEATATLDRTIGEQAKSDMTILALDQEYVVKPVESGLTFDAEATVEQVSGREWNPLQLLADLTSTREVEPVVVVDEEVLGEQLASLADSVSQPPVEPVLRMERRLPVLKAGTPGRTIDEPATADLMIASLLEPREPIPAPIREIEPQVSAAAADAAVALATSAVAAPVIVDAEGTQVRVPRRAIADALTFQQEGAALVPSLDGARLHDAIRRDLRDVETPGRDATFRIRKGKPVVVKSKVGKGIEDAELADKVQSVLANPRGQRTVAVTMGTREPSLTTEQARALGVKERISSFTQRFPPAAYRTQNIGQAAKYVNGTLLLPGETFSMNDTIKQRTVENGYTVGYIIGTGGVFDEALGGGVSAATTAVWTAAFFAGMQRTDTRAHSIYISRYQPGLEATVAWGVFDMKFTNDTPYGVFITTRMTSSSMTVEFWSTRIYDEIAAVFGPRSNVREYQTIYNKSENCSSQSGMNGFTINVDRVFFQGGKEVKRETITTNYRPSPKVVCGKKPKKDKDKVEEAQESETRPNRPNRPDSTNPTPLPDGEFAPE
jgi:vancomycin resistance protein YoaR